MFENKTIINWSKNCSHPLWVHITEIINIWPMQHAPHILQESLNTPQVPSKILWCVILWLGARHQFSNWKNHNKMITCLFFGQTLSSDCLRILEEWKLIRPEPHVDGQDLLGVVCGQFISVVRINDCFREWNTHHLVQSAQFLISVLKNKNWD